MPAALLPEDGQNRPHHPQRSRQVRFYIPQHLLLTAFLQGTNQSIARVVHHHIQPAKIPPRFRDRLLDGFRLGHVQRIRFRLQRMVIHEILHLGNLPRRHRHLITMCDHRRRQRPAKSRGCSCDEPCFHTDPATLQP